MINGHGHSNFTYFSLWPATSFDINMRILRIYKGATATAFDKRHEHGFHNQKCWWILTSWANIFIYVCLRWLMCIDDDWKKMYLTDKLTKDPWLPSCMFAHANVVRFTYIVAGAQTANVISVSCALCASATKRITTMRAWILLWKWHWSIEAKSQSRADTNIYFTF